MNAIELSKRLEKVSEFVPQDARLADIGSDHAYLPVYLMLNEKIVYAVAGEVVAGPFHSAQNQVIKNGLQDQIKVRLADGLSAIEDHDAITAITICGMGGSLIRDILESGKKNNQLTGQETLILQPNVGERSLRLWLAINHYQIVAEAILEEHQKIYEIIVAKKTSGQLTYSDEELTFGPFLLKEKAPAFQKKWRHEKTQYQHVLHQLEQSKNESRKKEIATRLAQIEGMM
jgi:tRNA (adenine22-N1)-methyltransferase